MERLHGLGIQFGRISCRCKQGDELEGRLAGTTVLDVRDGGRHGAWKRAGHGSEILRPHSRIRLDGELLRPHGTAHTTVR